MKYRKKPIEIEAIQLSTGSVQEIIELMGIKGKGSFQDCGHGIDPVDGNFKITTLEGVMVAHLGDYIIKGVKGEFYPCKPEIFEATYEKVEEPSPSGESREAATKSATNGYQCPRCDCKLVITERRPDGDSKCSSCGFTAYTGKFNKY